MESREFEMLLGRIEPDGYRRAGCIDKFQKETTEVISFVADEAEKRGLYEDAIRLHDLAKVCVHVCDHVALRGRGEGVWSVL